MSRFLSRALQLRERGYTVVPVKSGQKRPMIDGWQNLDPTETELRKWAEREYKNGNIGINTRHTPAVDIDVYDPDLAQEMEDWLISEFGADICIRVGRAPKRLVVFRTDDPFKKLWTTYTDGTTEHKLEILGAGQQFVAYGIHPDTHAPYRWTSLDDPLTVDADDLPLLTLDMAQLIIEKFSLMCEERGWSCLRKTSGALAADGDIEGLETYKPILALSRESVLETLDLIPNDDAGFEDWLEVGMALHHQFDGDSDGLELWHDWSAQSTKCEPAEVNRRWESFGKGPATVTFATLVYKAKKVREEATNKTFESALNRVMTTQSKRVIMEELIPALARSAQTDMDFDTATKKVQLRLGELEDGAKPRLPSVVKAFRAAMPKVAREKNIPKWCDYWVYVQQENNFYNSRTSVRLSKGSFDSTFGRELISEENRDKGESFAGKASDVALNLFRLPIASDYIYFPGGDEFVKINGHTMVNTYNHHRLPQSRAPKDRQDRDAIKMAERHFEILIKDERERRLLLDYLAYNVQFPSERVHWAPVLQGVDGGGKSWLMQLMSVVLGQDNIDTASAGDLHEQYTAWAEGKKMVFFEEVRVAGIDKYDIVNKIKAYLTNSTVKVRRMQRNSYSIPNMTNYFVFTNYLDAIPYDANDRRYFVLRTTFLTKSHIDKFNRDNPRYFSELFEMLGNRYQVLLWWLENREISEDFDAKGHAPRTDAWELMYQESNNVEDDDPISEAIREHGPTNPLITNEVLALDELKVVSDVFAGMETRKVSFALGKLGFQLIGRFRLGGRGSPNQRIYSRHSEVFHENPRESELDVIKRLTGIGCDDGFD